METPTKGGQKPMPMLTPKNSDGSQRVIKQIMVIDPNKLRSAGLDLKMAEALKKSKVRRTPTNSPASQTKDDKLALAKSILNKKLKQTQISKDLPAKGVATTLRPNAKFVENAVRNLTYSNLIKVPEPRPQIKVADLMSLMPPPSSLNKSQTVVINFLKCDQPTGAIDASLRPPESQLKIEADAIPKASIRKSSVNKNKNTPNIIESKVISPEVKFELKKKSKPTEINVSFSEKSVTSNATVSLVPLRTQKQSPVVDHKPPKSQKNLPQVIESKILSPEEKIDLRTLRARSPTKLNPHSVGLAAATRMISPEKKVATLPQVEENGQATNTPLLKQEPEESAVDFIKFMFEEKSKKESLLKVVPKEEPVEDATSFLMSLFGQQETLISSKAVDSTTSKRPVKPVRETEHTVVTKQSLFQAVGTTAQPEKPQKEGIKIIDVKENRELTTAHPQKVSIEDERQFSDSIITYMRSQQTEPVKSEKVMSPENTIEVNSSKEQPFPNAESVYPEEPKAVVSIDKSLDAVCRSSIISTYIYSAFKENENTQKITIVDKGPDLILTDPLPKGEPDSELCFLDQGSKVEQDSREMERKDLPQKIVSNDVKTNSKKAQQSVVSDLSLTEEWSKGGKISNLVPTEQNSEVEAESRKVEHKDPTNDVTPTADKANDMASKTTGFTRRKSTKSVPVLIAKLKKSRKPPDSQAKQTKKDEKLQSAVSKESETQPQKITSIDNVQPPESTEKAMCNSQSPQRKHNVTSIDRNQLNSAINDMDLVKVTKSTDLDAKTNKTGLPHRSPSVRKREKEEEATVAQKIVMTNSATIAGTNINKSEAAQDEMKQQIESHQTETKSEIRNRQYTSPNLIQNLKCVTKLTIEQEAKMVDGNTSNLDGPTTGEKIRRQTPKCSELLNDSLLDCLNEEKIASHLTSTSKNAHTSVTCKKSPEKARHTSKLSSTPNTPKDKHLKVVTKATDTLTDTSEKNSDDVIQEQNNVIIKDQAEKRNIQPAKEKIKECEEENLETSAITKRERRYSEEYIIAQINATHPNFETKSRIVSESQSLELAQESSQIQDLTRPDNIGSIINISDKPISNVILLVTDLQDNPSREKPPVDKRSGRRSISVAQKITEKTTKSCSKELNTTASTEELLLITKALSDPDDIVSALSSENVEDSASKGNCNKTSLINATHRSTKIKKTDETDLKQVTNVKTACNNESPPSIASTGTAKTSAEAEADENVNKSKEESVSVPSTSQKWRSINKKKEGEILATKVMSPATVIATNKHLKSKDSGSFENEVNLESGDSLQIISDKEIANSLSDSTASDGRSPRSRKKTVKFSSENESLTCGETKQKNVVDAKLDHSETINTASVSERISSPISDSWQASNSDGWDDSDSEVLIKAVTTCEKKHKSLTGRKPSSVTPDEKLSSQGKAKNPFKKVKKDGNADFFGFNEREIEEGQQSTSLRLSQSEDVITAHPLSPSEVSNNAKGSRHVNKTPLSGGKKLKAEQQTWTKNAAASLKNWLKAPHDESLGTGVAEEIPSNEMNSSIPPKKRRGREQNSNETMKPDKKLKTTQLVEDESRDLTAEDGTPDSKRKIKKGFAQRMKDIDEEKELGCKKDEEKAVQKSKDSELKNDRISQIADITEEEALEVSGTRKRKNKKELTKPDKDKAESVLEQNTSVISNENATYPSGNSVKKKSKRAPINKNSTHDHISELSTLESMISPRKSVNKKTAAPHELVEKSVNHNTESIGEFKTTSKSVGKKGKKADVEEPVPEIDELTSKISCQAIDLLSTVSQPSKRRGRPAKRESNTKRLQKSNKLVEETINCITEPIGEFKTPSKPGGRKRKKTPVEESTPEIDEPPCKISCELSEVDLLLTPPPPRRLGRPPKHDRPPKSSYKPQIPVSPLERKYKNDTEFNPRLLLIRHKEELKTDEPITDPDLQAVPKSKTDVQCGLCMGYTAKKKWLQHISSHYGVGWIMGTPPPVNVKSRASVLNYMVEFFKLTKVKGLNCRLCQGQRRSALGLLVHLEQCCMTEDELKESRVECEHCNNNYSRISIVIHLRSCPALMKSRFEEKKEEVKATDCVTEEDVLSNAGRLKRKSVIKAENKFKNLDDIEFIPDELIKHVPQQRSDNQPSIWQREILAFGKAFCLQKKCQFTATTVDELEEHCQENVCSFFVKPGYLCMKCKFHSETMDTVRNHVVEKHKPRPAKDFDDSGEEAELGSESSSDSGSSGDDEDENEPDNDVDGHQKPKKRRNIKNRKRNPQKNAPTKDFKKLLPDRRYNISSLVAKWSEKFIKKNYSKDTLFSFATPSAIQMDGDGCESYLPKSPISMKFITNGFNGFVKEFGKNTNQTQQWRNLERLQGIGMENEHTMYVGGPIKSIAWVPMEPHPPSLVQYLAIATRKGIDKFTRFVQPKRSRSLVFIQKYNLSELPELSGEIHYAFTIDKGPIHCIEFLPSGGYAPELNRLGMLAVATVETEIEIFSLPLEVEKRSCDTFPMIRLKPSFTLCLELPDSSNEYSEEYESQCTSLVWSQTAGHNYILGGYLNGYIAIWDISDEDDNLNRIVINGMNKFVPVTYFWTMDNRIKQIAAHYDMDGLRWLAVCNSTRKLLLYDLREISKPVLFCVDTTKNICNSMDWPVVWENLSYGLGDAMPSHGNCINTVSPMSLVYIHRRFDKFCCGVNDLHFNPWRNIYAAGADNGDIHITIMREAILDVGLRMKNDQKVISTLDLVPLDVNESSEKTVQAPADGWRLFETDYKEKYGLIFGSCQKIVASRKRDLYGTKRIPPLNMRRLMRVNRVRFNPNRNANALLAVGYDNGFVRVLHSDWYKKDLKDSNDDD